ncbi:MAG TPA: 3D domain-containing protein [Tepidisphaeraceae bacterium]|nr:3D domain-containing protein [Tepidisphaeraceae bacterium]
MTSIHLTSSQQIIRRVLVASIVIFTLGAAGTVVGRAASKEDVKRVRAAAPAAPEVTAPAITIEEPAVELAAAMIGPELVETVIAPELIVPVTPAVRTIEMEVTAYCPCKKCCGPNAQGVTASGKRVSYNNGRFVAADRHLKFGTKLIIPGYAGAEPVEVLDRGGAIKGNKLDVYFDSHTEALKWGRQKLTVTVVE